MAHVKRERDVMLECNNPFVVNLVASFQDAENVFMLMEAVMGGELFYYLQARAVRTGDRVQAVSGRLFARQQEIRAAFPRTPRAPPAPREAPPPFPAGRARRRAAARCRRSPPASTSAPSRWRSSSCTRSTSSTAT